jgi:sec-independent protein translocase protein TatC
MATEQIDLASRARDAVQTRAELPGMSLMEHLEELRRRIFWIAGYLAIGFAIAYVFHVRLYNYVQKPVTDLGLQLNFTHPTDGLNLYIKTAFVGGAIIASPFILYQIWLFISPGMYSHEKRYVWPFMSATIALFLSGAWFGYRYVLPGAIKVLVLPILIFFLALFGIVDAKFLLKHFRYAVMAIFLIAAVICPTPDPIGMCLFASPMLILYFVGVGVAFFVHPTRRKKNAATT